MGLKIGRALKKLGKSAIKSVPGAVAGFFTGGPAGAVAGAFARKLTTGTVAAELPSIQDLTGVGPLLPPLAVRRPGPMVQQNGGLVVPAGGSLPAVAMGLSRSVVGAIVKLAGVLGVALTAQNIGRVGMRLWRSVTALARRYPGVSILTFLTGLGLTLDEAGEFLFWGQTKKRRRRRGISGRDISITRRTLRRLDMFRARLGVRRGAPRRGRRFRGDGTVVVAQQD